MTLELDDDQLSVAEAPADARLLVIAGAGQGKTEVVAARLRHLADEEELSPSVEVLVLSFSRAAVHAVRHRAEHHDLAQANIRTFDSFASYLLAENGIEPVGGFENRIRQATKLLEQKSEVEGIEDILHLVIDEVQDLVGDRAEMVLALLNRLDPVAGFTALGDPLQGVYDFTLENSRSKRSSDDVFDQLTDRFGARKTALRMNYRARGELPKKVVAVGNLIREMRSVSEADCELTRLQNSLPHSGEVVSWQFLESEGAGTTAVLCETNGEVLRVSQFLAKSGIRHAVRRQAQDFGAAKWITEVLTEFRGPAVPRSAVEDVIEQKLDDPHLIQDAWYLLKGAEGQSRLRDQLDLQRLRNRIRSGAIPLTLTQPDATNIVISTVHRAKGLEFDRVFFLHSNRRSEELPDWETIRRRYVALSRARDEIAIIDVPNDWRWFRSVVDRQRQYKRNPGKREHVSAIEITSRDVLTDRPAGTEATRADIVQDALRRVTPGESLSGVFAPEVSDEDEPVFALRTLGGDEVGLTTKEFGQELATTFGYRFRDGWMGAVLEDITLTAVETVAGEPDDTRDAHIGSSGLWLVPRVSGLVTPRDS